MRKVNFTEKEKMKKMLNTKDTTSFCLTIL